MDRYRKLGFVPAYDRMKNKPPRIQPSMAGNDPHRPPEEKEIITGDPREVFVQPEFLYPDEEVALLFNTANEIEVENILYKVTPWGTFITFESNYSKLLDIINLLSNDDESKAVAYLYRDPVSEEYYKVEEEIYLADTFDRNNKERTVTETEKVTTITEGFYTPQRVVPETEYNTTVQNKLYDNLPVVSFGKKTILGKIFSFFGNNEVYTEKFDSKRRVKVKLYNVNYVIIKKLGMEVSLQKKNWIGWSDTEAEELRLGWDALSFNVKDNVTPIDPWIPIKNSFPPNGNPDWDRTAPPFVKPNAIKQEISLLDYTYSLDVSNGVRQGVKKLYDFLKTTHQRSISTNEASTIKVWKDASRKTSVSIATPCEIVYKNEKRIRVDFHRQTDVILSLTGISDIDLRKSVLKSAQASQKATTVTLDLASIYGVAKNGGKWLGARIEKK